MSRTRTVDPSVSRTPLPLDAEDLATVCVLCSHNCGLHVDVEDGRIAAVRADPTNPISEGYLCNKAFRIGSYVEHAQRVEHPLRRRPDGSFERISWDDAICEIAAKLDEIRTQHSPRAIGLVGIGGQANHMDAVYGVGFLAGLGSRRLFNALAQEKTQHFLMDQWMFEASPNTMLHADMEHSRFMLTLGTNPRISNRGHNANDSFKRFAEDPQRTLVVVDPRETETTRQADRHLRVRPGTDAYLLLGLAATIVSRGLVDEAFLRDKTLGFEEVSRALAAVDVEEMARRCGVEVGMLVETAGGFASADSASIFYDLGIEQTRFSTLNSYLIRLLLAITGNVGRPGGNVFHETFAPPRFDLSGGREPERALASGIPAIRALGTGMFSPNLVPEEVMLDHPERLRALIVEGSNPLLSYSDTGRWREALERLDLLVVIEPAMTETAREADYVLPTPVGYEKWEIAGFPRRHPQVHVQLRPPLVPGPPEALPEPEIYLRLAEALDLYGEPPAKLHELAEHALEPAGAAAFFAAAQELAQAHAPGLREPVTQLVYWAYRTLGPQLPSPALVGVWLQCHMNAMQRRDSVLRTLGPKWQAKNPFEIAAELFRLILAHPEGVEIARTRPELDLEEHLGFEDGRIRLAPEAMLPEIRRALDTEPAGDPEYPFVLASGLRTRWTANTIQRDPAWRKSRGPHCALNLSPVDAEKLSLANGDPVRITTRRGSIELPAQVDKHLLEGHVWMPNGFGTAYPDAGGELVVQGANLNQITDATDRDPFTGCPHHRYVPCRLERVVA